MHQETMCKIDRFSHFQLKYEITISPDSDISEMWSFMGNLQSAIVC